MRGRGIAEAILVVLAAFALTFVLTFPLIPRLAHVGRLNTDDGRWSIWVVSWVAHALAGNPLNLFHANIFYPEPYALAYSEANIGAGVVGLPVWLATGNPYATHNAVVVIGFLVSAAGGYYLVRYLTGSRSAGAVAAVLYAFCPFVFARTAHIQLLLIGGLPFCMLAFHRLVDRATTLRAVTLGLVLWAQALSCAYYGIFAGLMVGAGTIWFAVSRDHWRRPAYWGSVVIAAFVAVGLTLPFFLPYLYVQQELGFSRTLDEAREYSANAGAWLASSAWAHRWWLPVINFSEVLFPGLLATTLGLTGIWVGLRPSTVPQAAAPPRDVAGLYAIIVLLTVWASFGPDAGLYTAFFQTVPVFSFLRAPARMGIMATLGLTVLAGIALAPWFQTRRRQYLAASGVVLAAAAELTTAPLVALREAPRVPAAYRVLATLPRGAVAEFPFFYRRGDFPRHAAYMLGSTAHWQPLVNGYSDHIPQSFRAMVVPLSSFPTRESFAILGRLGARYVVLHLNLYDRRSRERTLERLDTYAQYLRPLSKEGNVWLFEIVDWPN